MAKTLRELFVDRARQLDAFQKMLAGQTPRRIMVLTAGPGMGKSWLIRTYAQAARDHWACRSHSSISPMPARMTR